MRILRTVPNVKSADLAESRRLYCDTLGYHVVMDLDWIITFASPSYPHAQLSAVARDPSGHHPDLSIEVDDVDTAYAEVQRRGFEVVYALRDEPWGVRRFFARDPHGAVLNVVMHHRP